MFCLRGLWGLDVGFAEQTEDVRGHHVRAQSNVVTAIMPLIVRAGEEIFYVKGFVVRDRQFLEVEIDPSCLLLSWIEIDGDENLILAAPFAVAEDV